MPEAMVNGTSHSYRSTPHGLYDYSHKPPPIFRSVGQFDPDKDTMFGIELEMSRGRRDECLAAFYREIRDFELYFYPKSDSSIGDGGIEIVSHPWSWQYWNGEGKEKLQQVCDIAVRHGMTSHDNGDCGLHVHCSKRPYAGPNYELFKFRLGVIVTKLWNSLVIFSRRDAKKLGTWAPKPFPEYTVALACTTDPSKIMRKDGHRAAVNTSPTPSIEFRMYRGSLKVETILASIGMSASLLEVARGTEPLVDVTFRQVLEALPSKELLGYCMKKKISLNDETAPVQFKSNDPADADVRLATTDVVFIGL